ncbi:MAG TPA: hypothetical protein VK003_20445, partial [Oceanobacillus sp.]|nr:hypothetical protein [Oceanobacillus sp.]
MYKAYAPETGSKDNGRDYHPILEENKNPEVTDFWILTGKAFSEKLTAVNSIAAFDHRFGKLNQRRF